MDPLEKILEEDPGHLDFIVSVFKFLLLIKNLFIALGWLVGFLHFYMEQKVGGKLWW